ncbi:hypothetical protein RchiOBHm_Chr3g0469681 [Rosa chinensis]|uniref:Uncharacterized protein n=1 Tax=Rosa chinensis TaxID=74649 RepID=A0A2P6RAU8_ROSCH|nr:hypothetical protein RchiOBHm_Chr3g0469681 [Rosa chinensis]
MERIQINDIHILGESHTLTIINETVRLANIVPAIFRKAIREIQFKDGDADGKGERNDDSTANPDRPICKLIFVGFLF